MRLGLATFVALTTGLLAACSSPQPAILEFVDQSPAQPRLGEITTLRFRAIDSRGLPQAGVQINFEVQAPVPGVELNPTVAATDESNGIASTQVVAKGGRVSSVVVVARVGDKSAISPAVTFAGSNSTSRQFTFQCGSISGVGSGGVHAINAYDETRNLIAGVKLDCIAHVADRNGDGIAGAQVSFLTEAGTIGPSSVSVTDVVGNAKVLYKTSLPLPDDVQPGTFTWNPVNDLTHTGEYLAPLWMHPFEWVEDPIATYPTSCSQGNSCTEPSRPDPIRKDAKGTALVNNPRDNLVSMIAVTSGEEAFDDRNNNGTWDEGEPFVDLTEPFVDNNDNGTWDAGERYVDANGNGQWDGKNGTFDPVTLIWVQERILWTGIPHAKDRATPTRPVLKVLKPNPATTPVVHLDKFGQEVAEFLVADPWFNSIARNGDDDGCSAGAVGPVEVSKLTTGRALTYPSYTALRYVIKDQRDPTNTTAPDYPAGTIKWTVTASCAFTASPVEGYAVAVEAPAVVGDFNK
ncbi:hypothetical protein [Cystobacter ferrugineus]|uniref:Big-1 domain-containing protein n=1 Tax=Cystobacter ferrugineus TaxID=83449 RepID=A0A1L9BCL8_9BACT|nr:hypothetical protein [Cystobacter ferrugineus]OJH40012.1 hypothetical protein BON30_13145 [Cystobacter ferrugineus]